jgi:hypothetical protein
MPTSRRGVPADKRHKQVKPVKKDSLNSTQKLDEIFTSGEEI